MAEHAEGLKSGVAPDGRHFCGEQVGSGSPDQNKMTFEALAKPRTSVASIAPACNRRANGKVSQSNQEDHHDNET
jgi:hypothetical protein